MKNYNLYDPDSNKIIALFLMNMTTTTIIYIQMGEQYNSIGMDLE